MFIRLPSDPPQFDSHATLPPAHTLLYHRTCPYPQCSMAFPSRSRSTLILHNRGRSAWDFGGVDGDSSVGRASRHSRVCRCNRTYRMYKYHGTGGFGHVALLNYILDYFPTPRAVKNRVNRVHLLFIRCPPPHRHFSALYGNPKPALIFLTLGRYPS